MGFDYDFSDDVEFARSLGISDEEIQEMVDKYKKVCDSVDMNDPDIDDWIRDRRSPKRFISDLVGAWITEDIASMWITAKFKEVDKECIVSGGGSDKDRIVQMGQRPKKVTTKPDFHIDLSDGRHLTVEFQFSNNERDTYDIKDSKVDRAEKHETVFLFMIKPSRRYFVLKPQRVRELGNLKPNPLWGGKPCYNIHKDRLVFRDAGATIELGDFF